MVNTGMIVEESHENDRQTNGGQSYKRISKGSVREISLESQRAGSHCNCGEELCCKFKREKKPKIGVE